MAAQQPDFFAMPADMNDASHAHASMAIHLERMQNIPAFNAGAEILEAIRAFSRRVDDGFEERRGCERKRGEAEGSPSEHVGRRGGSHGDVAPCTAG